MNDWEYHMLSNKQTKEAVEVFKLIIHFILRVGMPMTYGEALLQNGQKEEAIKMYQKSVALNPDNNGGKKILEGLLR